MMQFNTISDDADEIKLSVGRDIETGKYFMPSLEFTELKEKKYPDMNLFWDNEVFIFNKFPKFLKRYIKGTMKEEENKHFKKIIPILSKERAEEILLMLEEAKKQGWYNEK